MPDVTSRWSPVSTRVSVSCAPATAAWLASRISPETCESCACRVMDAVASTPINSNTRPKIFMTVLILFTGQVAFLRICFALKHRNSNSSRVFRESMPTTKFQGPLARETADVLCVPCDQTLVRQAPGRGTTPQNRDRGGHKFDGSAIHRPSDRVGKDNIASMSIMSIDIVLKLLLQPIETSF